MWTKTEKGLWLERQWQESTTDDTNAAATTMRRRMKRTTTMKLTRTLLAATPKKQANENVDTLSGGRVMADGDGDVYGNGEALMWFRC